jgi:acyl carrier protein
MNTEEIKAVVVGSLSALAPEADLSRLDGRADLREALDVDSMDFLRFVQDLHAKLHVDVPERDYPRIRTLDGVLEYLTAKLAASAQ